MNKFERDKRIKQVTAEVGYRSDLGIRPAQLSMGEEKLIAFARAMTCRPKLLYLDEWTESLDQTAAHRLINLVKKMRTEGTTVIMVSHDIRIIRDLADTAYIIQAGQVSMQLDREQISADDDLGRYIEKGAAG
jgi:ABC-type glutathione transport system ATPase component